MVDDICVSSCGPVYSVFLAHSGELAEIDETMIPVFERIGEKNGDPMFMHEHSV